MDTLPSLPLADSICQSSKDVRDAEVLVVIQATSTRLVTCPQMLLFVHHGLFKTLFENQLRLQSHSLPRPRPAALCENLHLLLRLPPNATCDSVIRKITVCALESPLRLGLTSMLARMSRSDVSCFGTMNLNHRFMFFLVYLPGPLLLLSSRNSSCTPCTYFGSSVRILLHQYGGVSSVLVQSLWPGTGPSTFLVV